MFCFLVLWLGPVSFLFLCSLLLVLGTSGRDCSWKDSPKLVCNVLLGTLNPILAQALRKGNTSEKCGWIWTICGRLEDSFWDFGSDPDHDSHLFIPWSGNGTVLRIIFWPTTVLCKEGAVWASRTWNCIITSPLVGCNWQRRCKLHWVPFYFIPVVNVQGWRNRPARCRKRRLSLYILSYPRFLLSVSCCSLFCRVHYVTLIMLCYFVTFLSSVSWLCWFGCNSPCKWVTDWKDSSQKWPIICWLGR